MSKTIGRNQRKRVEQIFANAQNIRAYTLANGFTGKPCNREDPEGKNWLFEEWDHFSKVSHGKLIQKGGNKYCLRIHSDCWYEFTN